MTVKVLADSTVNCHAETLQSISQPWLLGPFDHLLVSHIVTVESVFVYQSVDKLTTHPVMCPNRLRSCLDRLLDFYPQLTGRFVINPLDNTPEIHKLGAGALYRTARCDRTLDSFRQSCSASHLNTTQPPKLTILDLPGEGSSLWCPFDISIGAISTNPALTVQHTVFTCGSVSLGVRVHHWACDAEGFFQLMAHLSEIYEASLNLPSEAITNHLAFQTITLKNPPIVQSFMTGTYQTMSESERNDALQYQPKFFRSKPVSVKPVQSSDGSDNQAVNDKQAFSLNTDAVRAPIVGRVMRFSAQELKAIKHDTMKSINQLISQSTNPSTDQSNTLWVSTYEALTAHLHQRIFAARAKIAESTSQPLEQLVTDILMPVNFRSPQRLNLSNSQSNEYFPNADIPVFATFTPDDFLNQPYEQSISQIAVRIHSLSRELKPEDVIATLKWISAQPNKQTVYQPFRFPGGFMCTQWNKMNMYKGATFNQHSPVLVSKPFTEVSMLDGFAHYMATEEQLDQANPSSCGIDVIMSVNEHVWKQLDNDVLFRRHATR